MYVETFVATPNEFLLPFLLEFCRLWGNYELIRRFHFFLSVESLATKKLFLESEEVIVTRCKFKTVWDVLKLLPFKKIR